MAQKICIITGANSGIGKAAAVQINQAGYHVILACRNPSRAEAALEDIDYGVSRGLSQQVILE